MTWTKLDGRFYDDETMLSVSPLARLLHVDALCWSGEQGKDGHIPAARLARIADWSDAHNNVAELITAGIWRVADDLDGWQIVRHLDDQPTAKQAEEAKASHRLAQERYRRHKAGDHSLCDRCAVVRRGDASRDRSGDASGDRTRPVPSRPVTTVEGAGTGKGVGDSSAGRPGTQAAGPPPTRPVIKHNKDHDIISLDGVS